MLIRTEAPADILAVDRLLKRTFPTDQEAKLVMALRENSNLTLALVACDDNGALIGHIMFSPVTVEGVDTHWQGLAPLAVDPEHQHQGIGKQLVTQGLEFLTDFSYPACVVLGDGDFYSQFGFQAAENIGLRCPWDVPKGAFQFCELTQDASDGIHGLVEYSPEFNLVI
ncbi:GNAT family N-acetyltransferase [Vibrio sp. RC27]